MRLMFTFPMGLSPNMNTLDTGTYHFPVGIDSLCLIGMIVVFLVASALLARSIARDLDADDRRAEENNPYDGFDQFD